MANETEKIGVLLVNLGSPDDTSVPAVRRYLQEFLSDRRIIDLPRWQWLPILYGIVLRTRPPKTAEAYESIWTEQGSPLIHVTDLQCQKLQARFQPEHILVDYAMRYGNPSIEQAIQGFMDKAVNRLIILPLYPQYSRTTVESVYDKVDEVMATLDCQIPTHRITHYYQEPTYIKAVAHQIQNFWQAHEVPEQLIFSYHGVPVRYIDNGDIYYQHCLETTELIAAELGLDRTAYTMTFQSRFGREEWCKPYTDETLKELALNGIKTLHIISPAFSADCLETLEELEEENREYFEENGGEIYRYIPALNDDDRHIDVFERLISGC